VEEILKRLGKRIHDIRVKRGFASQEALADYLKVHRTFVGHLETGRKDFRLTTIIRIAEALGVPIADLFTGIEADEPLRIKARGVNNEQSRFSLLKELGVIERSVQKMKALASGSAEKK
jgi:transcriptional regulator with XRE-family HTH domain